MLSALRTAHSASNTNQSYNHLQGHLRMLPVNNLKHTQGRAHPLPHLLPLLLVINKHCKSLYYLLIVTQVIKTYPFLML